MIEIEIETKPNVDSSVMVVYDPVESKGKAGKVAGILVGSFVAVMLVFALIFNLKIVCNMLNMIRYKIKQLFYAFASS